MFLSATLFNYGDQHEGVEYRSGVFMDKSSARIPPSQGEGFAFFARSVVASASSDDPTTNNTAAMVETSGTSTPTILACNSISIVACILTLALYLILSFRKKYKRLMRRTSLSLAACMAASDLVLHCSNLAGYGTLPPGFTCAFVGGWLFAAPSLLSIFYSCCIAFNSQLVFVFHQRPSLYSLRYYILISIALTLAITLPALGTGTYGYDESWGYCWYSTHNSSPTTVLIRMIFTYTLPTLLCILYLLLATITIYFAVFGKRSLLRMSPLVKRGAESMIKNRHNKKNSTASSVPATSAPIPRPDNLLKDERRSPPLTSPTIYSTFLDRNSTSSPETTPNPRTSVSPFSHSRSASYEPEPSGTLPPIPSYYLSAQSNPNTTDIPAQFNPLSRLSATSPPMPLISERSLSFIRGYSYGNKNNTKPPTKDTWRTEKKNGELARRRTAARRQLSVRLIGYLITPILCLLPGIILDLLTKVWPLLQVPDALNGLFDGLNGLIGLLNSALMLSDPALLAVWADFKSSLDQRRSNCFKIAICPLSKTPRVSKDTSTQQSTSGGERDQVQERDVLSGFGIGVRTRLEEIEEEEEEGVEHGVEKDGKVANDIKEEEWQYPPKPQNVATITSDNKRRKSSVIGVQTIEYESTDDLERGGVPASPLEVRVQVDVEVTSAKRPKELELMENWLAGL